MSNGQNGLADAVNQFRIDSHKLHLHPRRTADWLEGKNIAPVYMEISPSGACNHRCRFCGLDFLGYRKRFLPADLMVERLTELGAAGLKSVMFAGEGEPFLHPEMPRLAQAAKEAGIDVAFTTNAVLLTPDKAAAVLPHASWIKISCNAGTPQTYADVHQTRPGDFPKMLENARAALTLRQEQGGGCAIGFQMVLLPENQDEAVGLAETVRDLGADYLVIKPYSVHRQSGRDDYLNLRYGDYSLLAARLAALDTMNFKTVFRREALARLAGPAPYTRCQALPFWGYVDSGGSVWGCLRHIGEDDFLYGNLLESSVEEILNGPVRREKMARLSAGLDITDCRTDCRMDPVNIWLQELKNPGPHVNFI